MASVDGLRRAILLQKPTVQQQDAIFAEELEYLLRATPGSGKTWTSCRRFIWRGANWLHEAGGLALLSFTNVAIKEFKLATTKVGMGELLSDPNYVGTFDSFVERYILSPFGHLITGAKERPKLFISPRPGDYANEKFSAWVAGKNGSNTLVRAWEIFPYPENNKIRYRTSNIMARNPVVFGDHNPVNNLFAAGYYTHGQRVYWACRLLFSKPRISEVLSKRFPEIIVDEAQDCNAWLLVLMNYLRRSGTKITLVGDPDQCIYEFSMADATSLPNLKEKWKIPEKPLSQSFRCVNSIANAVRPIGGNMDFEGSGVTEEKLFGAYIYRQQTETYSKGIRKFVDLSKEAGISLDSAAIICRGHNELDAIRGKVNYTKLQGKTKELAKAVSLRDLHHDYKGASQIVTNILRELTGKDSIWDEYDLDPESPKSVLLRLSIWKYVKDSTKLPPISKMGEDWINTTKTGLSELIADLGVDFDHKIGRVINKRGLDGNQLSMALFQPQLSFPKIRQDTIHKVKGESISAVLTIGSSKFWNSMLRAITENQSTEDRRLAYVAMTRARYILVVALPYSHFDCHHGTWVEWGFKILE